MPHFLTDSISISTDGVSFGALDVFEVDGTPYAVVDAKEDSFTAVQLDRAHIHELPEDAWDGPLMNWYTAKVDVDKAVEFKGPRPEWKWGAKGVQEQRRQSRN